MNCLIKWIDEKGKPTPDTNSAIGMAHFHKPIFGNGRIIRYSDEILHSFPICAEHYARVDYTMRSAWSFTLFNNNKLQGANDAEVYPERVSQD